MKGKGRGRWRRGNEGERGEIQAVKSGERERSCIHSSTVILFITGPG